MENSSLLDLEQLGDEMFEVVESDLTEENDGAGSAWAYACCHSASSSCALS
ncbi:hypothetical protein ACI2L4_27440 [Streptomyces sparsogenes]|uniref:Uncharacterized protein n=2 Tax=Streptomyces TaxID=1883 RepID=A0A1R1S9V9_9ACTN|nr:hypothetical protein [Streptomyces sparsogenes]OMI35085.1 hypothetical protein SPAR_32981 [Streptomyces sparsogenes DSM 40356]